MYAALKSQPMPPCDVWTPGTDAMAEYALFRFPPPPSDCAAAACAAVTLYRSEPTPDLTSDVPADDVTRAIVTSAAVIR